MNEEDVWNWLIALDYTDMETYGCADMDGNQEISIEAILIDMEANEILCDFPDVEVMIAEAIDYCS